MSQLDWQWPLKEDEKLLWQGRPAPRCYTFRHWKLSVAGMLLFFASSFWMMLGYQLILAEGYPWWLMFVPLPLVLLALYFGPIILLKARIEWEKEFYALTDQHVYHRSGLYSARVEAVPATDLTGWQKKRIGSQLVSVRLLFSDRKPLVWHCIEQPDNLIRHFEVEELPINKGDSV